MEATRLDAIPVVEMQQQTEARAPEDDWTGLTSPAERRKIQNRINQRIYRRRHTTTKRKRTGATKTTSPPLTTTLPLHTVAIANSEAYDDGSSSRRELQHDPQTTDDGLDDNHTLTNLNPSSPKTPILKCGTVCHMSKSKARRFIEQLEDSYKKNYLLGSPRVDQLLTLIQFNVFRALLSNDVALGFKMEWLDAEAVSPFNSADHEVREGAISCPASLRPTALQRTVPHHPWIDLFPIPNMRDNMLRQGEDYDDTPLCMDLVEFCHSPGERMGMIVWGDPWNPDSWEVSEEFLSKWAWIVTGCHELFRSTNYWRAKRGERPLVFKV